MRWVSHFFTQMNLSKLPVLGMEKDGVFGSWRTREKEGGVFSPQDPWGTGIFTYISAMFVDVCDMWVCIYHTWVLWVSTLMNSYQSVRRSLQVLNPQGPQLWLLWGIYLVNPQGLEKALVSLKAPFFGWGVGKVTGGRLTSHEFSNPCNAGGKCLNNFIHHWNSSVDGWKTS